MCGCEKTLEIGRAWSLHPEPMMPEVTATNYWEFPSPFKDICRCKFCGHLWDDSRGTETHSIRCPVYKAMLNRTIPSFPIKLMARGWTQRSASGEDDLKEDWRRS